MSVISEKNWVDNLYRSELFAGHSGTDIIDLCKDVVSIVYKMRQTKELSDPVNLRNHILQYLSRFKSNCKIAGYSDIAVNDALYAIVSLIDETVLSIPGDCRCVWLINPLQLHLFNNVIAGEEFYSRLDKLFVSPQQNTDILKIYYLCLSLGFEGKYKIYNSQERIKIVKKLSHLLIDKNGTVDFHIQVENGNHPVEEKKDKIKKVLVFLTLIFSLILTFEIITFKFLINEKENEIINQLRIKIR